MTEYKSVIVVQTNEAGQPTNLLSLEDGDTISDDVLSLGVRGAASAVEGVSATVYANSATWDEGIDPATLADLTTASARTDTLVTFSASVETSTANLSTSTADISGYINTNESAWAAGIDAGTLDDIKSVSATVKDTSGDLVNASSTFNTFSGDIQVCTVYVSGLVDDNTTNIGILDTSTTALNIWSGTVDTSVVDLDASTTALNVWSGTVDTSVGVLDGRVVDVEGLVPSAAGYENWNTIYGDRANIIEASTLITSFRDGSGALAIKNTVGAAEIDTNAVTNAKIAANAVDTAEIAAGAVTTAKILNSNVTLGKIQNINAQSILGNNNSVGTLAPLELTTTQVRTLINVEDGATADQTDAEIETAYNNQVNQVSDGEKTNGTETGVRRFSPKDIADMAGTHGGGGGGGDFTGSATASGIQVLGASSIPISGTAGEAMDAPKNGYVLSIDTAAEKAYWRRSSFQATSIGGADQINLGGDISNTATFNLENVEMTLDNGSFTTTNGAVTARKINAGTLGLSSVGQARFNDTITFDDGTALGKIQNISNQFSVSSGDTYLGLYGNAIFLSATSNPVIRQEGYTQFNGSLPDALTGGLDAYNKKDSGYYCSFLQLEEAGGGQDINQATKTYISFDTSSGGGSTLTDYAWNGSDTLTINTAGTYEISVNIGVVAGGTGTTNQRTATVIRCEKAGTDFGPTGKTGYIRLSNDHEETSHHLSTFVTTFTAGQALKVGSTRETTSTGSVLTSAGECFFYIRRII
jgi:hypothetical protein